MSSDQLTNIVIGIAVVAWLLVRQMQPRPTKETSAARLVLILGVIGLIEIDSAVKGHAIAVDTIALFDSLAVGGALGALRPAAVAIRRAPDGTAWRKGTVLTVALWIVSLATHSAIDGDHRPDHHDHGARDLQHLGYLAVTLGVQREIVRWRAAQLTPATPGRAAGRAPRNVARTRGASRERQHRRPRERARSGCLTSGSMSCLDRGSP